MAISLEVKKFVNTEYVGKFAEIELPIAQPEDEEPPRKGRKKPDKKDKKERKASFIRKRADYDGDDDDYDDIDSEIEAELDAEEEEERRKSRRGGLFGRRRAEEDDDELDDDEELDEEENRSRVTTIAVVACSAVVVVAIVIFLVMLINGSLSGQPDQELVTVPPLVGSYYDQIEKEINGILIVRIGRSPHGERGLKYNDLSEKYGSTSSLPARGAWIEILSGLSGRRPVLVALHKFTGGTVVK